MITSGPRGPRAPSSRSVRRNRGRPVDGGQALSHRRPGVRAPSGTVGPARAPTPSVACPDGPGAGAPTDRSPGDLQNGPTPGGPGFPDDRARATRPVKHRYSSGCADRRQGVRSRHPGGRSRSAPRRSSHEASDAPPTCRTSTPSTRRQDSRVGCAWRTRHPLAANRESIATDGRRPGRRTFASDQESASSAVLESSSSSARHPDGVRSVLPCPC